MHEVLQTYNQALTSTDASDTQQNAGHVGRSIPGVVADGERLPHRSEDDLLARDEAHRAHGVHRNTRDERTARTFGSWKLRLGPRCLARAAASRMAVPEGASFLLQWCISMTSASGK